MSLNFLVSELKSWGLGFLLKSGVFFFWHIFLCHSHSYSSQNLLVKFNSNNISQRLCCLSPGLPCVCVLEGMIGGGWQTACWRQCIRSIFPPPPSVVYLVVMNRLCARHCSSHKEGTLSPQCPSLFICSKCIPISFCTSHVKHKACSPNLALCIESTLKLCNVGPV